MWTKQKSIIAKSCQNLYALLVIEGDFGNGILNISNDFTQVLADFGVALNSFCINSRLVFIKKQVKIYV